jgi:hypothetical protein
MVSNFASPLSLSLTHCAGILAFLAISLDQMEDSMQECGESTMPLNGAIEG